LRHNVLMTTLTIGKLRGLKQIASPEGIFTMCALDHRGSFRRMINPQEPASVTYQEIVTRKLELCSALGPHASALLIDPIFGAAQSINQDVLPRGTGLLVSTEATGYEGGTEHRVTALLEEWGVEKIRRMGASAAKMLVYYRPDLWPLALEQLKTVSTVATECLKHDLPFLVEPVSYPVGKETGDPEAFARQKERIVIQTARDITSLPIDVLKAEFPADLRYRQDTDELVDLCRQLNEASRVPWVILSAGVDFDTFARQVEIACRGGASGFLGGRAIWQEAMDITEREERVRFLSTVAAERTRRLADIAHTYGTPWYRRYGDSPVGLAEVSETWHQQY